MLHGSLIDLLTDERWKSAACLLLEERLPGCRALDFLIETADRPFATPVVLMTGLGNVQFAVRAMRAGAIDVLPKLFTKHQLLAAIEASIETGQRRRRQAEQADMLKQRFDILTRREREVLELVTAGLMNKQVAWHLGLSEVTVKIHRGNVMRKMRAKSLPDLVRMTMAGGMSEIPGSSLLGA